MNPQYRFFLKIGDTRRQAYPIYGDDLSKNYSQESGLMFFRTKLEGKLKFTKADFDFIMSSAFDDTVYVDLEMYNSSSNTWVEYFKGRFMRTDCVIVPDDMMLEVSLTPDDPYEIVLSGLEKEFNLIELAPEIKRVGITKRPAIQVYAAGDSVVSSFVGGTYFEQVSSKVTDENTLKNTYKFDNCGYVREFYIEEDGTGTSIDPEVLGAYVGFQKDSKIEWSSQLNQVYTKFNDSDIQLEVKRSQSEDGQIINFEIHKLSTNTVIAASVMYGMGLSYDGHKYPLFANSGANSYYMSYIQTPLFARVITDADSVSDVTLYDLPIEDIVDNNMNYKKVYPYSTQAFLISSYYSTSPTEYGIIQPGQYFTKPPGYLHETLYPVSRSQWVNASIWFRPTNVYEALDTPNRKKYTLQHAYTIESCISVLLQQITKDVYFLNTSSRFLSQDSRYNNVNPVSSLAFSVLITQKTNILKGEYDQPAQKAMVTLKQIFDMLRDCFQCYWYITKEDDGYELHVEHISYFINGLRYPGWDGTAAVSKDLTLLKHPRSGKPWSYGVSEYSFEKEDMPEWYQFTWSDDVSVPFKGYPIEILSGYVKKGNVENVSVNKFVSDVDLMLLNPSAFSEDGMVLLIATASGDTLSLPFVSRTVDNVAYTLQNGYAAFCDLQERYYLRSMPASKVIINKAQRTVVPTRGKKQEVEFPVGAVDPNIYELVKTSLGDGQIKDMNINLSSRLAKVTLMHDTEK